MNKEGDSYSMRISINKCRKNEGTRTPVLEHHSNNCSRRDPTTDAKNSRQKFIENQDIHIVSKYLPQDIH